MNFLRGLIIFGEIILAHCHSDVFSRLTRVVSSIWGTWFTMIHQVHLKSDVISTFNGWFGTFTICNLNSNDRTQICVSNCFRKTTFGNSHGHFHARKFYFDLFWWFHFFPYWSLSDEEGTGLVHLMLLGTGTTKPFGFIPNSSKIFKKSWRSVKLRFFCSLNRWFFPSQDVLKERYWYHQLWYSWQILG